MQRGRATHAVNAWMSCSESWLKMGSSGELPSFIDTETTLSKLMLSWARVYERA
jgi:hypothetical protein